MCRVSQKGLVEGLGQSPYLVGVTSKIKGGRHLMGVMGMMGMMGDNGGKVQGDNSTGHWFVLKDLILMNFSNKSRL